jgi:hypothetical protein
MGDQKPRVRAGKAKQSFYGNDRGSERWREWASDHNRSAEYDNSATGIRRSWFGRLLKLAGKRQD